MPSDRSSPPSRKFNIELLLGLSATFLSFAALTVSIFQTKIAREQQHASVWPYLNLSTSTNTGSYSLNLENKGIGPAIIKDVKYEYDTASYNDVIKFFWAQFGFKQKNVGYNRIGDGTVFKSGEIFSLISISANDSLARQLERKIGSDSFRIVVVYSDVYGNCWRLENEKITRLSNCIE